MQIKMAALTPGSSSNGDHELPGGVLSGRRSPRGSSRTRDSPAQDTQKMPGTSLPFVFFQGRRSGCWGLPRSVPTDRASEKRKRLAHFSLRPSQLQPAAMISAASTGDSRAQARHLPASHAALSYLRWRLIG